MPCVKPGATNAVTSGTNLTIAGGSFDLAGFNQTLGNITFGDGSSTAAASLIDPAPSRGATLNLAIAFKGTTAFTTPPAALAANVSLPGGTHNITIPSGFGYSNGVYDLVISGVLSGTGGININGISFVVPFPGRGEHLHGSNGSDERQFVLAATKRAAVAECGDGECRWLFSSLIPSLPRPALLPATTTRALARWPEAAMSISAPPR